MSEYEHEDELEDDETEPEDDYDPRVVEISQELARWEEENGVELTDQEFDHAGRAIGLYGLSLDDAVSQHTDHGREQADFADLVSRIEADQNRTLADSEIDRLWESNERAELRGEDDIYASEVLYDLDTSDGIAEYIGERLAVPQEREQPSAVQVDDDGCEVPSFNLDNRNEQVAAIDALMAGEAVTTHDNDHLAGDK